MPILAITEPDSNARMVRGLEIGVNDYLMRPIDKNELLARARSQVRKRRYTERLRDNVQISIEMAITDALTGLFNRRYMESHLAGLLEQASARGKPLAVLVIDIDYFKSINDTHGHDAGDDVPREFALRIKRSIRGIDLACRYGGDNGAPKAIMCQTSYPQAFQSSQVLPRVPVTRQDHHGACLKGGWPRANRPQQPLPDGAQRSSTWRPTSAVLERSH
jgi:Diguanylate cyclase, GGDEF domain